jgi:hypothetical protein
MGRRTLQYTAGKRRVSARIRRLGPDRRRRDRPSSGRQPLSDLSVERALEGTVSLAPAAVSARLRAVSEMRDLGLRLRRAGRAADEALAGRPVSRDRDR